MKGIEVEQINFAKIDLADDIGQVFAFSGGKVINTADIIALGDDGPC